MMKWLMTASAALLLAFPLHAQTPGVAPAMGLKPVGAEYNEREWLEDVKGHDKAIEMQSKYKVPMLIFFYADWNDDCQYLWKNLLDTSDFKNRTRQFIKLKINPEHGKEEGKLANKYRLRKYPTTMAIDRPHADPRRFDLIHWSFGKLRTAGIEEAIAQVMGEFEALQARQKAAEGETTEPNPSE